MKCLFLFWENSLLPQVAIPDIAHGIHSHIGSDLVVAYIQLPHSAHSHWLASPGKDFFFIYFRVSQKHTFHFHFWCLFSRRFGCELANDDRRKVENLVERTHISILTPTFLFQTSKKHRIISEHFSWLSLDWPKKRAIVVSRTVQFFFFFKSVGTGTNIELVTR